MTSSTQTATLFPLRIPVDPREFDAFRVDYVRHILSMKVLVPFRVRPDKAMPALTDYQRETLDTFFEALRNFQNMTPEIERGLGIKLILRNMAGETTPTGTFILPHPYPAKAQEIWDSYELENWGAPEDDEFIVEPQSVNTAAKPKRTSSTAGTACYRPAPPDHPIYGTNGIMHDIRKGRKMTTSYKINPALSKVNYNVRGHNGLRVGQWWPLQICALRDGAHGKRMAGIAGSQLEGVFSVIVSGAYDDLDSDHIDWLWYSGSNAHTNTDPLNPEISDSTKALQRSCQLGHRVRVIRSAKGRSSVCPSVGLRYDGLYVVAEERQSRNKLGGAYVTFRLQRCSDQDPIDRQRPTAREKREYELVAQGY